MNGGESAQRPSTVSLLPSERVGGRCFYSLWVFEAPGVSPISSQLICAGCLASDNGRICVDDLHSAESPVDMPTTSTRRYPNHFEELQPNYNVAPTDRVYGVIQADQGRRLGVLKWGLVPYWSESPKDGAKRINARAETVATKPIFRDAFARRRCLLPADGFYEWQKKDDGTKQPIYIFGATHAPLGLAGIWERWKDAEGQVLTTCSVITTRPNALMAPIHDRMPVVLPARSMEDVA